MNSNWSCSPEKPNLGQNRRLFLSPVTLKFDGWHWKTIGHLFNPTQVKLCASFHSHPWIQTGVTVQKRPIRTKIGDFFVPCYLEIWRMTLKNNRAPLLCCFKLCCASFHSHHWIQTGVTARKSSIRIKIGNFLSRVTLKFDGWPWKTIEHLYQYASSFVHHFIAIGVYRLELQSGNAQFGSKLTIFLACDLKIWRMTLNNNRAPLLSNIKLCASFHRHMWIQTGFTVRKRLNGVMTSVTLTFDLWPWPFSWISFLLLVITPENFRMIGWLEHCQKGVTDGRTDGRKEVFLELLGRG